MRKNFGMGWVLGVLLLVAHSSIAQEGVARVTLSTTDTLHGVTAQMHVQTDKIKLTGDQQAALKSNPHIDASAGPLALAEFTVRDGKSEVDASGKPFALAGKASLMIPFKAPEGVRPAELDAFLWDGEAKQWRLAGCQYNETPDFSYEVATSTQVYPALNALLAQATRLGPIAVFRSIPSRGLDPKASEGWTRAWFAPSVKGLSVSQNKHYLRVRSEQTEWVISKDTGSIYKLGILEPVAFDYTPADVRNLQIYVVNKDLNIAGVFDICKSFDISSIEFQGDPYLVIDMALGSSSDFPARIATAHLQYRIGAGLAFVKTDVTFTVDDPSQFEVGVSQGYDQRPWETQVFPSLMATLDRPIRRKCMIRYSDIMEDRTKPEVEEKFLAENNPERNLESFKKSLMSTESTEFLRQASMPWSILEGKDYFLMYGYLDLNTKMLAAANRLRGIPAFQWQPLGVTKGRTYTYDYFMKFFPRPENTITDVCKWYAINRYSTNELSKDYVKFPAEGVKKTIFGKGNWGGPKYNVDPGLLRSWDETYPTTGTWWRDVSWGNEFEQMNPEKIRKIVHELREKGTYVYPYSRQIRNWSAYHTDRPPYREWAFRGRGGYPFSYFLGSTMPVEDQMKQADFINEKFWPQLGIKNKVEASELGVHDDFGNPDFVNWYIKDHCDFLKAYDEVQGFYFDMGWDTHLSPTMGKNDIWHGELKAVAEISKFGRTLKPQRLIFMNGNAHSPQMNWVVADFIDEGGLGANKLGMDCVKFTRVSFSNIIYDGQWVDVYGKEKAPRLIVEKGLENLSAGITYASSEGALNTDTYKDYHDFSAYVTPMPILIENDSVMFVPQDPSVTGTIWADQNDLRVAIFNNSTEPKPVEALLDLNRIRQYGYKKNVSFTFQRVAWGGTVAGDAGFRVVQDVDGWVRLVGTLPAKTLLMAQ